MVESVTVDFSEPVMLGGGAITLSQLSPTGGTPDAADVYLSNPSGDGQTYVLTFVGSQYLGNSLPDGVYNLAINAALVTDAAGASLSGGNQNLGFYRLYGDYFGNGTVGFADLVLLAQDFGETMGQGNYLSFMDIDGSGTIGFADLVKLAQNFDESLTVPPPPGTIAIAGVHRRRWLIHSRSRRGIRRRPIPHPRGSRWICWIGAVRRCRSDDDLIQ